MKRLVIDKDIFIVILSWGLFLLLPSCNDFTGQNKEESKSLSFFGLVNSEEELETRALSVEYITESEYPYPIYLRMDVDGKSDPFSGIYEIKSGYEGRLTSMGDNTDLNWVDSDSGHKFYGWTMPWKTDENIISEYPEEISFDSDYYNKDLKLEEREYYNCAILEKFIGTEAGPVNYRNNGEYVELQFRHLVSKIYISSLNIVTNDGSTWQNVSGEITIFNFPKKGYFHRHPSEEDKNNPLRCRPYVKKPVNPEDYGDMTYEISKGSAIYICPEIDFQDLQFKIKVNWPAQQGVEGEYYGDFSGFEITRRTYNDEWDREHQGKTILYANEVINLNLTLRQGNVTGMTATIGKWTDKNVGTSSNYPRKGVYNSSQFSDLLNSTDENIDELYELYGGEPDDKDKVFHVYNDLEINSSNLEIPDGYTLDGMGHTVIKISEDDSITLKNVRNVYITNGDKTIFIDSDGKIFIIDIETGKKKEIGQLTTEGSTTININELDIRLE